VVAAFKIFNRTSTQPSSNRIKLLVVTGKTRTGLSDHEESKQPFNFDICEKIAEHSSSHGVSCIGQDHWASGRETWSYDMSMELRAVFVLTCNFYKILSVR
jgi:hypothetical protein